jgi:RNA polymerase sigma-70 factor (ECF subfamily)
LHIDDETRIVEAARRGDVTSFGRLYDRYYATMVWLAYSVLRDHSLAEDAAQEAFAVTCDELKALSRPEKFAGWLSAICRNVAYKMARQRSREIKVHDMPAVPEESRDEEREEAVREAIVSLREMYREVVILRYYNKMSYEDIEAFLGIPRSKVKSRLFAARRKIAKYLDRKGLDGEQSR